MYTTAFESAVNHLMLYEVGGWWNINAPGVREGTNNRGCGYVNDPDDAGGETKYGIAKTANPTVDIANLDWEGTKALYYKQYWLAGACDKLSSRLAVLHFDGCVNNGVRKAGIFLQRAIYVTADGAVGPATIAKSQLLNEGTICNSICDLREQFYQDIVKAKPSQIKYLAGWLRRIDEMRAFVLDKTKNFD